MLLSLRLLAGTGERADTVVLGEVIKTENYSGKNDIRKSVDVSLTGKRLSKGIGEFSSVYIKNYGNGQLASLAVRGTSASQTDIQWNGIRLNSPSLGQVDLSLFQLGMQDELQLLHTGFNGTIGGTLRMNNSLKADSNISLKSTLRYGNFNTFETFNSVSYGYAWLSGSTKVSYQQSENNFTFRNISLEGNPKLKQKNASYKQFGLLQQLNAQINLHNSLHIFFWYNDSDRNLPPVMTKNESKQKQYDQSYRSLATWNHKQKHIEINLTGSFLKERLIYRDFETGINDTANTIASRNIFSLKYIFQFPLVLNTEINYDFEQAQVNGYNQKRQRNTVGIKHYADYYFDKNFRVHAGFRQDVVDGKGKPFSPLLMLAYAKAFKNHQLSASVTASRNFRVPSLNDLYWEPGGNQNLRAEKSWNAELLLRYKFNKYVSVTFSNFYIHVSDWIQWVPTSAGYWQAQNFRKVFSRGFELNTNFNSNATNNPKVFGISGNASYTFTKTTNLEASSAFDNSKGKQLIYVPLHNATISLQGNLRGFYIRLTNSVTGKTFTSTDNSESLPLYAITDAEIGKSFYIKNHEIGLAFRLNNLANIQYQVVAQRPMPGRNFEITLNFNLK